jgi:hypothetical protein
MTDQAVQPPVQPPAGWPVSRPDDRRDHPRRRVAAVAVLSVLVLVALAWWIWVALVHVSPAVRFDLLGFRPVSASTVEIRFSVLREPGVSVACVLRARGESGAEVGRRQILIPADATTQVDLTSIVRTVGPAVTGEVLTCLPYEPPDGSPAG